MEREQMDTEPKRLLAHHMGTIGLCMLPGAFGYGYGRILVSVPALGIGLVFMVFALVIWAAWPKPGITQRGGDASIQQRIIMVVALLLILSNFFVGLLGGITKQPGLALKTIVLLGILTLVCVKLANQFRRPVRTEVKNPPNQISA